MYIRSYKEEDAPILRDLFWNTVHTVNAADYTMIQLDAWAPVEYDRKAWNQRFLDHTSFVVENDGHIVGFGDIDAQGYLDRLFVHKDHQNEGIGTMLCDALEALATKRVITQASITAKPFFEYRGYRCIQKQIVYEVWRWKIIGWKKSFYRQVLCENLHRYRKISYFA